MARQLPPPALHTPPAGAQYSPDWAQTPSRTHMPMPRQSALFAHSMTVGLPLQTRKMSHGPDVPHSLLVSHIGGAPARSSGKYCRPTPRPTDCPSRRNAVSAARTASHLVWPLPVAAAIDPELSIMM